MPTKIANRKSSITSDSIHLKGMFFTRQIDTFDVNTQAALDYPITSPKNKCEGHCTKTMVSKKTFF